MGFGGDITGLIENTSMEKALTQLIIPPQGHGVTREHVRETPGKDLGLLSSKTRGSVSPGDPA